MLSPEAVQLEAKESNMSRHCSKWCVVEGVIKTDEEEGSWQRIVLSGGRPVVANRFGKLIPFLLEPSVTCVPKNVQDNLICGSCVRKNEGLHCNPSKRTGQLSLRKQRHCNGKQLQVIFLASKVVMGPLLRSRGWSIHRLGRVCVCVGGGGRGHQELI